MLSKIYETDLIDALRDQGALRCKMVHRVENDKILSDYSLDKTIKERTDMFILSIETKEYPYKTGVFL